MQAFFIGSPNRLELFGALHNAVSAIFAVLCALVIVFRKNLANPRFHIIGKIAAYILSANMLVHYSSRIILGIWSIEEDLPLHLCFITNFFMIYILLTDDKRGFYEIIYYFTVIGPLPAMIFPDLRFSPDSWVFWQFVISHHFMLLVSVFCLAVKGYAVSLRGGALAFIAGNAYIALISLFNRLAGTNYAMINALPEQLYEVFPFLSALPPIFWLEAAGVLSLAAAYKFAVSFGKSVRRVRKGGFYGKTV